MGMVVVVSTFYEWLPFMPWILWIRKIEQLELFDRKWNNRSYPLDGFTGRTGECLPRVVSHRKSTMLGSVQICNRPMDLSWVWYFKSWGPGLMFLLPPHPDCNRGVGAHYSTLPLMVSSRMLRVQTLSLDDFNRSLSLPEEVASPQSTTHLGSQTEEIKGFVGWFICGSSYRYNRSSWDENYANLQ